MQLEPLQRHASVHFDENCSPDSPYLPRRSRYYQGYIDTTQLKPGTVNFNRLGDIIQILIAPFDLIGEGRYRYTFRMCCMENRETILADGAVRIFLNTHGKNPQDISPELAQLLHFMEHTNDSPFAPGRMREGAAAAQKD